MDKKSIIEYFNSRASHWDAEMIRSDEIIGKILDNAGVTAGKRILDVACGTGVLIPDYLSRSVGHVTGIDMSPNMAEIARRKFGSEKVAIICGDVEEELFDEQFDCIVVYNALPHFVDPDRLIRILSAHLLPGGTLTVAHGMSRERINSMHPDDKSSISRGLISSNELSKIFERYLHLKCIVDNDKMFEVVGVK